jgi:predicted MFS family arabinose efflux permease
MPPPVAQSRVPLGLLAAAGFLSALGARIVDPLLAVLARDFQTSVATASILVAAFTFPYGMNQLLIGPLGDRFGKLRVLLVALSGYTIFMTACALASDLPALTMLRACAGACSGGLIPTCMAYIGDTVPYENRQVALGRFLTGVVLAQAAAGPLGGLFGEFLGWRGVFVLLGVTGLCVVVLLTRWVRHVPETNRRAAVFDLRNYRKLLKNRPARLLLLMTLIEGAWLPGAFPFIAPYMVERFSLSYAAVGLILSAFGLGAFFYTHYAPILLRIFGEAGLVLAGGLIVAGSMAVAFQLESWVLFIGVQMALGLGYFMLHGVMQARATELLPDARSTAVSSFIFMLFLGQAIGALAMGTNIGLWGYRVAFHINLTGVFVLTLFLFVYMRRGRHAVPTS